VSPRGASDWWRESVCKSVSVHQDKIRGSAILQASNKRWKPLTWAYVLLIPEICRGGQRLTCGPTLSTN